MQEIEGRMREVMARFPWLVCEGDDGQVVGYSYASPHRSRCAYEWSVESAIYVDTAFARRGVGKRLYQELFVRLRAQGVVNVLAGITLPNTASVGLHEALGFTPIGRYRDIGFKLDQWWDVGWWQLQLQRPERPEPLSRPPPAG